MSDNVTASQSIVPLLSTLIPVFTFILGLLGKIFYDLWHDNYVEKKRQQKEALKNHFIQLNENVITPLIIQFQSLKNKHGEISPDGKGRHWSPEDADISLKLKDWKTFSFHFEKFADTVQEIIEKINTHNKEFDDYIALLTEKLNKIYPLHSSFLTPSIFTPELLRLLMNTLFQLAENSYEKSSYPITHDFNEAIFVKENGQWIITNRLGAYSTKYATLNSEADCEHCKQRLIDLQNSQGLQKKTYELNNNAKSLVITCNNISGALEFLRHSYEKLGKTLEKVEDCYYCQMIFDIS